MGWAKTLSRVLKAMTANPPKSQRRNPPAKRQRVAAPRKTATMVPSDFIDLTENEAFLICEMMGKEGMSGDSRMTTTQRLVQAVEDEMEPPTNLCTLLYWDHHDLDAAALPERLRPLSSKQAQCIISAAKRFWKLEEKGDLSEAQELMEVGLVRRS